MQHQGVVIAVAFGPAGKAVLTGSADKTARFWDAATGQPIGAPLRHQAGVLAVAFHPDGKSVLTCGYDKTARLWKVPDLEGSVDRIVLGIDVITGAALDTDGTVRWIDPATWRLRRRQVEGLGGPPGVIVPPANGPR